MKEIRTIIEHYERWRQTETVFAMATVVNTEDSSYRRVGARMLVAPDGRWVGGISGGCLEGDALSRAQRVIRSGGAEVKTYDTRDEEDREVGIGLGCEGRIDVLFSAVNVEDARNPVELLKSVVDTRALQPLYTIIQGPIKEWVGTTFIDWDTSPFSSLTTKPLADDLITEIQAIVTEQGPVSVLQEVITPAIQLLIVGHNYDVIALGQQCQFLGWPVRLVGTSRKFSLAHRAVSHTITDIKQLENIELDAHTAVVLMSHDYAKDLMALRHFLPKAPPYLGLLGPVKRKRKLLKALGVEQAPIFVHGPVGLNIGAQTPEEIALSITADILRVFRGRPGGSLRNLSGSIYHQPMNSSDSC